jgi:hypothetical protein
MEVSSVCEAASVAGRGKGGTNSNRLDDHACAHAACHDCCMDRMKVGARGTGSLKKFEKFGHQSAVEPASVGASADN